MKLDKNYKLDLPIADEKNENSCLCSYFQFELEGNNTKLKVLNEMVMQFIEEPFFN